MIERTDPVNHDFGEDLNLSYAADSELPLAYRGEEVLSYSMGNFSVHTSFDRQTSMKLRKVKY